MCQDYYVIGLFLCLVLSASQNLFFRASPAFCFAFVSVLLSLLSLVMTYTIILLQTNDASLSKNDAVTKTKRINEIKSCTVPYCTCIIRTAQVFTIVQYGKHSINRFFLLLTQHIKSASTFLKKHLFKIMELRE